MTAPTSRTRTEKALAAGYRALLSLLPKPLRQTHGEDMEAWFIHRLRSTSGIGKVAYVLAAALDAVRVGIRERFGIHTPGGSPASAGIGARVGSSPTGGLGALTREATSALRALVRRPGWSLMVAAGLTLPVAANTAIYAVVEGAVLAPLPYPASDRLAMIWAALPGSNVPKGRLSGPELAAVAERSELIASSGAIWSRFATVGTEDGPEHVDVGWVTGAFFETLGTPAAMGRTLLVDDDVAGGEPVVLLTHDLWERRFGGDPDVVGTTVDVNGEFRRVVGVLPDDFSLLFPGEARLPDPVEIFAPWGGGYAEMDPDWHLFAAVARLRDRATAEAVDDELDAISRRLVEEVGTFEAGGLRLNAEPLRSDFVAAVRPGLTLLLGGALLLLLVAAANTAGLLLVRNLRRTGEFTVMAALGAGRGRIMRAVGLEAAWLFLAAAGAGLALAVLALAGLDAVRPAELRFITEPTISPAVLFVTLAVLAAVGAGSSMAPILRIPRDLKPGLSGSGRGRTATLGHGRNVLVAGQVALSLMLLVGAGLMFRSLAALEDVDRGFVSDGVATFRLSISGPEFPYENPHAISGFYEELRDRLGRVPGVQAVGLTEQLPLIASVNEVVAISYETPEGPVPWGERTAHVRPISRDYFASIGATMKQGRDFRLSDDIDAPPVAIVGHALAESAWPGRSAIGEQIQVDVFVGGEDVRMWAEVVGVVDRVKLTPLSSSDPGQVWLHHLQSPRRSLSVTARTQGRPEDATRAFRDVLRSVAPDRAIFDVRPLSAYGADSLRATRFLMAMTGIFALLALTLAALGLFGVLSYVVAERRREIGIRMSLGATPARITRSVLGTGLRVVGSGAALGLVGAYVGATSLASLVFGIEPRDTATFVASAGAALAVGLLACYAPARDALRVAPSEALE